MAPFLRGPAPILRKKGFPPNLKEFPSNSLVLKIPTKILTNQYPSMVSIPIPAKLWATELSLAAIGLVFPALGLAYNYFTVKSMTYQFLYSLKNVYDYRWQQWF